MPNKPLASSETSDSENGTAASEIEPGLASILPCQGRESTQSCTVKNGCEDTHVIKTAPILETVDFARIGCTSPEHFHQNDETHAAPERFHV
jgi:hypothetical protein